MTDGSSEVKGAKLYILNETRKLWKAGHLVISPIM